MWVESWPPPDMATRVSRQVLVEVDQTGSARAPRRVRDRGDGPPTEPGNQPHHGVNPLQGGPREWSEEQG